MIINDLLQVNLNRKMFKYFSGYLLHIKQFKGPGGNMRGRMRRRRSRSLRRWRWGEVGTLELWPCAPVLVSAVQHLSVGQLGWRQSGRDGVAGDGQLRVEVAGHHGGQRAEHVAELVRRSLLSGGGEENERAYRENCSFYSWLPLKMHFNSTVLQHRRCMRLSHCVIV